MTTNTDIAVLVNGAVRLAHNAAEKRGKEFLDSHYQGVDKGSCGFAWVKILKFNGKNIRANSTIGKALAEKGITKDYTGGFVMWNPSNLPVQNIDCKEAGAYAASDVLSQFGFECYASSRLD